MKYTKEEKTELLKMAQFCMRYDDFPDGAFFAIAQENGFEAEDWGWYVDMTNGELPQNVIKQLS